MEETLTPRRTEYAGLATIEFPAPKGAPTLVVFHGYGADGSDLAPIAMELRLTTRWRYLFPDAPLPLDWGGRAWFHIDVASIDRAQRTGQQIDWSDSDPEAMKEAREAAFAFLEAAGVEWDKLVLGGFSQGSMLATDLALRAPKPPRGLAILSGNLVAAKAWKELAPARKGLPFFMSHGIADPILGFQGALRLETLLKDAGLSGELLKFEGGHAIPPQVQQALRTWLSRLS